MSECSILIGQILFSLSRLLFRGHIQTVLHLACAVLLVVCVVSLFYGKVRELSVIL